MVLAKIYDSYKPFFFCTECTPFTALCTRYSVQSRVRTVNPLLRQTVRHALANFRDRIDRRIDRWNSTLCFGFHDGESNPQLLTVIRYIIAPRYLYHDIVYKFNYKKNRLYNYCILLNKTTYY